MDSGIRILTVGPGERDTVLAMYDRFDPLGGALGLPPRKAEVRSAWVWTALSQVANAAAFSPGGHVVGHCFLAADKPRSAELAVFVHQNFRRRGIGTALWQTIP